MSKWQVINGNNIDILREYPDNTFDSIVTDPPYGIEFLGKDWDSNTGAMETWEECFRVLKPGGYILAFSAARTYHHLATNIEMAGFEIRDQIMWLYGSGFPKAQDIGKALDKRNGKTHKKPDLIPYDNKGADSESLGAYRGKCPKCLKDQTHQLKCNDQECVLKDTPADNEWSGWKTALKPAHEPIVMARKPFKGSTIDNVLTHGVGALNIDASRVGYADEADLEQTKGWSNKEKGKATHKYFDGKTDNTKTDYDQVQTFNNQGRYPSNVLGDIPDYQKYFYCPKVSRRERMEGNNHPTVKPVELMKYLIKLVTPPNGRVLDPFNGSGSTGMAAVELGYEYVGCELDPEYVEIANNRISAWEKKFDTPANNLFD